MSEQKNRIIGGNFSNNGEDGIRNESSTPLEMIDVTATGNKGHGFNNLYKAKETNDDKSASHDQWYKKPIGILGMSIAGIVLGTAAVWALSHYFS